MIASVSTIDMLALIGAIPAAAIGGHLFMNGLLGVAAWARLPNFLVATTLAAFATSSPELTVSIMAALSGEPAVGMGDALGSNVVNIALILAITLIFRALPVKFAELRRDLVFALVAPLLTLVLASDGAISRLEGGLLLSLFGLWLTLTIRHAVANRRNNVLPAVAVPGDLANPLVLLLVGLAGLVLSGRLFVTGATGIGGALGLHNYVIGVTIVALGTSMPELVTALLSRRNGHDEIGLGMVIGSNLFNGLAIVGLAAVIHPIAFPAREAMVTLGFGVLALLLVVPRNGSISRPTGLMLLASYAAFVMTTLMMVGAN